MCWVPNKYSWSSSIQLNCVWPELMGPSEIWCFYSDEQLVTSFRFTAKQPPTRLYGVITQTNTIQTIWCSVKFSYSPSSSSTAFHCCNTQHRKTAVTESLTASHQPTKSPTNSPHRHTHTHTQTACDRPLPNLSKCRLSKHKPRTNSHYIKLYRGHVCVTA